MIYEAQCPWVFPPFHQKCTKRKTNWQGKDEVALQSSLQPVRPQRLVILKDVFLVLMCTFHHPSRWISLNDLLFCALRFFSGFSRLRQIGSFFKRHAWIWMRNPRREKDDRILGISWSWRADIPDTIHTLIDNPKACCKKKKCKNQFRSASTWFCLQRVFDFSKLKHIYVRLRSFLVSIRKKESARNERNALTMCFSIF